MTDKTLEKAADVIADTIIFGAGIGLLFIMFSLAIAAHAAETSISAGFGGGNGQCGSFEPAASIAYDRDSDDLAAHTHIAVGPNGSCAGQGTTIDAAVTKVFPYSGPWGGFVTGGYDERTIPFEYGVKTFRGYGVKTVSAIAGVRYDCGDECSIRIGYNAVDAPLAKGGDASSVFLAANYEVMDQWELSGDTNFTVTSFRLGRTGSVMDVSAGVVFGAHRLDHPAPSTLPALDDGGSAIPGVDLTRRDPPSPIYTIHVGWRL